MAYPHSRNPFADDDDEEETAGSRSRGGGGFNFDDEPPESNMTEAERRQRYLQQEVMRTAQSAVDSSHRSLGLLYEAEKVGTDTAEVRDFDEQKNCFFYLNYLSRCTSDHQARQAAAWAPPAPR